MDVFQIAKAELNEITSKKYVYILVLKYIYK